VAGQQKQTSDTYCDGLREEIPADRQQVSRSSTMAEGFGMKLWPGVKFTKIVQSVSSGAEVQAAASVSAGG
jgi:hypothetical protein